MDDRKGYISQLEDFKRQLDVWRHQNPSPELRSQINKKIKSTREIVIRTGSLKTYTISPPPLVGGMIMRNIDPFTCIFNPPYGQSIIPGLIDMIDEAIGVIEANKDFTLKPIRQTKDTNGDKILSNRVFLVHGRENELKESSARFLERLGLDPIILHEKSNKGLTVIEKFEEYADVAFAVVLMTPDDLGSLATEKEKINKRARQNVIFELGYFIGKLGRKNVVGLVKDDIEIPSDYTGIMYIGVDNNDGWKMMLAKEIKQAGLEIDLNKIFE